MQNQYLKTATPRILILLYLTNSLIITYSLSILIQVHFQNWNSEDKILNLEEKSEEKFLTKYFKYKNFSFNLNFILGSREKICFSKS